VGTSYFNERDVEIPCFLDSLQKSVLTLDIKSLLDVGGHYSWYTYASKAKSILGSRVYDCVDILDDEKTRVIVDNYIVGNVLDIIKCYDFVSCISTIEHSGISTYKVTNPQIEILRVFNHIARLASQVMFFTFPFGAPFIYPGEYTNITKEVLDNFCILADSHNFRNIKTQFFFNELPAQGYKWNEVSIEEAKIVEVDISKGTRCVCVLEARKEG